MGPPVRETAPSAVPWNTNWRTGGGFGELALSQIVTTQMGVILGI